MEHKGAGVLAEHDTELRKSLLCGFGIIEQVINAKEYEDKKRSLVLPVSTRVAGLSTVHTLNKVLSIEANMQRLPPTTYQDFYKVMLEMIDCKVFDNRNAGNIDNRDQRYTPIEFEPFKTAVTSLNVTTQHAIIVKSRIILFLIF